MSFSGKMITAGVIGKAVLMGVLVEVLALTSFTRSIVLVLVSACATGCFGIIIVLVQVHAERGLHHRIDHLESKANTIESKADTIVTKAEGLEQKAETIEGAVAPGNGGH